jgi:hypothetical protein
MLYPFKGTIGQTALWFKLRDPSDVAEDFRLRLLFPNTCLH